MYSPLNPLRRGIRLLYLHPGCFEDRLECELAVHRLNSPHCPQYKALSYTWGDPASAEDPKNTILVGGSSFAATRNLVSALRHLRHQSGDPICLWADAVCIDQTNFVERSHQVGMMRQIYASAKRVVIWLGEADQESDAVMSALHGIATAGVSYLQGEHSHLREDAPRFFLELAERRPWFTRMWIAQELAVASEDPMVVCGMKSVSWSTLVKAWKVISRELFTEIGMVRPIPRAEDMADRQAPDTGDDVEVLAMLKIDVLDELRQAVQRDGGQPLRQLLWISRTSLSTDPRDRVYALLGLMHVSDNTDVIAILADYSKPTWAVYADAMEHIFSSGQGPYCLSYLFLPGVDTVLPWTPTATSSDEEQAYLPTWVPDFSRQTSELTTKPSGITFQPPADRGGASGAGANCHNGQRVSDRVLRVEGLWIDTIQEIIPFGTSTDEILANLPRIQATAIQAKGRLCQFEQPVAALIEQFKRKEPLWRTLISNKKYMSGHDEAPLVYEDMYLQLTECPRVTGDNRTEYEKCLVEGLGRKAFFTTTCGLVGTCVPDSRAGDIAVILFGSPVPFILRQLPAGTDGQSEMYALIGASYVSGIMDGEMVDELYCEDLIDSTTFLIT